jgi:hypothetical protein
MYRIRNEIDLETSFGSFLVCFLGAAWGFFFGSCFAEAEGFLIFATAAFLAPEALGAKGVLAAGRFMAPMLERCHQSVIIES